MSEQKNIRWLYEELPRLMENGVITKDAADKLKDFYGPVSEKSRYSLALIIAGILGAVLIGGGIILIFAYNWEFMSRSWRTFFSFLPLVTAQIIYSYTFFKKKANPVWEESSSAFLMLMLAATIALISQTYHIGGELEDFLWTWMALSIPLLYLMESRIVGIIYLMGITSFVVNSGEGYWYWGFLLVALPYFYWRVWQNKSSNGSLWLTWVLAGSFLIGYWRTVDMDSGLYAVVGNALILSIFYLLANRYYAGTKNILRTPLQTIAVSGIVILAMILTYSWPKDDLPWRKALNLEEESLWFGIMGLLILLSLIVAYSILVYLYKKAQKPLNDLIVFFPLIIAFGLVLNGMGYVIGAKILANIYLFLLGLSYLRTGLQDRSMSVVNQGIGIIGILIIARFFDTDWPIIMKGIVFVILGLGFLTANFFISKRLKS